MQILKFFFKNHFILFAVIASVLLRPEVIAGNIYDEVKNNVVLIESNNTQGSGFFLNNSLIITNKHVISDSDNILVKLNDNQNVYIKAKVLLDLYQKGGYKDLVILGIDKNLLKELNYKIHPIKYTDKKLAIGTKITIIGHQGYNSTCVPINGEINYLVDNNIILSNIGADYGTSGSPVFNQQNELIGITTFKEAVAKTGIVVFNKHFLETTIKTANSVINNFEFSNKIISDVGYYPIPLINEFKIQNKTKQFDEICINYVVKSKKFKILMHSPVLLNFQNSNQVYSWQQNDERFKAYLYLGITSDDRTHPKLNPLVHLTPMFFRYTSYIKPQNNFENIILKINGKEIPYIKRKVYNDLNYKLKNPNYKIVEFKDKYLKNIVLYFDPQCIFSNQSKNVNVEIQILDSNNILEKIKIDQKIINVLKDEFNQYIETNRSHNL